MDGNARLPGDDVLEKMADVLLREFRGFPEIYLASEVDGRLSLSPLGPNLNAAGEWLAFVGVRHTPDGVEVKVRGSADNERKLVYIADHAVAMLKQAKAARHN